MKFQEFNKIPRLSRDMIITEKIDGTNAQIAIFNPAELGIEGEELLGEFQFPVGDYIMMIGSRTRWIAPGKGTDNMGFASWVLEHSEDLLKLGEGIHYGEWWGSGIQRGYGLKEKKFSLFNVSRWGDPSTRPVCCDVVPNLYTGIFSTNTVECILSDLERDGSHAAPGYMKPEGIVIYHVAGGYYFKKTIDNDESPKGLVKEE